MGSEASLPRVRASLGENELVVARQAQVVFAALVVDYQFTLTRQQHLAGYAPRWVLGMGGAWFQGETGKRAV